MRPLRLKADCSAKRRVEPQRGHFGRLRSALDGAWHAVWMSIVDILLDAIPHAPYSAHPGRALWQRHDAFVKVSWLLRSMRRALDPARNWSVRRADNPPIFRWRRVRGPTTIRSRTGTRRFRAQRATCAGFRFGCQDPACNFFRRISVSLQLIDFIGEPAGI